MPPKKKNTTTAKASPAKKQQAPSSAKKKETTAAAAASASPARSQKSDRSPSPSQKKASPVKKQGNNNKSHKKADENAQNELAKTHANELWETLKLPNTPVHAVADTMVNKTVAVLLQDVDAAAAALLTLVCKSAGLEESLDASRVGDTSNAPTDISELIARVPNDMQNFPLSEKAATAPAGRRFRRIFALFWEQLPKTLHAQSLDEYSTSGANDEDDQDNKSFVEIIMPWLGLLSDAKARNFRMSASLAMFCYIHGSAKVLASLEEAAVSTKTKRDAAALEEQTNLLRQRIDELFSSSFHVRTRDVASDIRLMAFQCLRRLIEDMPNLFLTNRHIRYFGVAFNDKRSDIRLEALEAVTNLLTSGNENAQKLQDFTRYFSTRIVEMKDDVETKCADLALKTAAVIVHTESKLSSDETNYSLKDTNIDTLLNAVTDDRVAIRRSAGVLLRVFVRYRTGGNQQQTHTQMHFVASLCLFGNSLRQMYGEKMPEKYVIDSLISQNTPLGLSEAELDALIQIAKFNPEFASLMSSQNTTSSSSQQQQNKKNNKKSNKNNNNTQDSTASSSSQNPVGAIADYTDADVAAAIRLLSAVFSLAAINNSATGGGAGKLSTKNHPSTAVFGPTSKDDLRVPLAAKMDDETELADLVDRLVRETATSVLKTALTNFPESEIVHAAVVEALSVKSIVAAFPLRNSSVNEIINIALKQPTLTGPVSELPNLALAWQSLGTVDSSGLKDVASASLQQLTKAESNLKNSTNSSSSQNTNKKSSSSSQKNNNQSIEQVGQSLNLLGDAWARVAMVAGVTNLTAQWAIFEAGLLQQSVLSVSSPDDSPLRDASSLINSFDCRTASYIVEGAYHTILWAVHEASENLQNMLESAIPRIATIVQKMAIAVGHNASNEMLMNNNNNNNNIAGYSQLQNNNNQQDQNNNNNSTPFQLSRYHVTSLCAFLDILSLPLDNFSLDAKETIEPFIASLAAGIESACEAHKGLTNAIDNSRGTFSLLRQNNLRRDRTFWESILTRLCAGFARIIVFSRLATAGSDQELEIAAKVMRLWAKIASTTKPAGEIMKQLFHTIREQRLAEAPTSDVGSIDKAILKAAYDYCANQGGASSIALEEFHAIGAKLATMHMPFLIGNSSATGTITAAERFYPAVPGVVELGIDLAESDDMFLHAVVPYCSRLKQPHACSLIDVLAQNEYFSVNGEGAKSNYARAFVAALRRAAKLDGTAAASGSNAGIFATTTGASVAGIGRVAGAGAVGTASTSAPPNAKRQMKLGGNALNAPTEDEQDMFNEILRSKTAGVRRGRGGATASAAPAVQQEQGEWTTSVHQQQKNGGAKNAAASPSPQKKSNAPGGKVSSSQKSNTTTKGGKKTNNVVSATQQSNNSSVDDEDDDDMLLATQEWN